MPTSNVEFTTISTPQVLHHVRQMSLPGAIFSTIPTGNFEDRKLASLWLAAREAIIAVKEHLEKNDNQQNAVQN